MHGSANGNENHAFYHPYMTRIGLHVRKSLYVKLEHAALLLKMAVFSTQCLASLTREWKMLWMEA
jgi:hypothetical protein